MQITFSVAVVPSVPAVRVEFFAATNAPFLGRRVGSIGPVVFLPPFKSAPVTAESAIGAHPPIHGELFTAVGANLRRAFYAVSAFLFFLFVIHDTTAVTAKPPQPSSLAGLLNMLTAFRTGIHRNGIIPLCIIVFDAAFAAAVFLPCFVATRLERLPAA